MIDEKAALRELLIRDAAIAALIGGPGAAARYFPGTAPAGTKEPYITWQRIGDDRHSHQGGTAALASPLFQLDLWGPDSETVDALEKAIRGLDGFRGLVVGVDIAGFFIQNAADDFQDPHDSSESQNHGTRLDVTFWYRRET